MTVSRRNGVVPPALRAPPDGADSRIGAGAGQAVDQAEIGPVDAVENNAVEQGQAAGPAGFAAAGFGNDSFERVGAPKKAGRGKPSAEESEDADGDGIDDVEQSPFMPGMRAGEEEAVGDSPIAAKGMSEEDRARYLDVLLNPKYDPFTDLNGENVIVQQTEQELWAQARAEMEQGESGVDGGQLSLGGQLAAGLQPLTMGFSSGSAALGGGGKGSD